MPAAEFDVAIIGGGPGGASAAVHLARAGCRVIVCEKDARPMHKVCGEFLSAEGLPYLRDAGVEPETQGAVTVSKFRLFGPRRFGEADLPRVARGLSRIRLDEALLQNAAAAGAEIRRAANVSKLEIAEGGVVRIEAGAGAASGNVTGAFSCTARAVILASGKADFRALPKREGKDNTLTGFKMHLRLEPEAWQRLRNSTDLFVFRGGYGGLTPVEDGAANFCFLANREILREAGGEWTKLTAALRKRNKYLDEYLRGAQNLFAKPVTVAAVPYGYVRTTAPSAGVYGIGDQLAVIPSLTGDGMTIALMSARRAAEWFIRRGPEGAAGFHREMAPILRAQVNFGFHVHRLFRSPLLCDVAAPAISVWPRLLDEIFSRTRAPDLGTLPAVSESGI